MSVILDFDITSQEGRLSCDQRTLHQACIQGDLDRISGWLEQSVCVDSHNPKGWAPLHLAAFFGHGRAVALLLDAGAHINIRSVQAGTCNGCTPLHAAVVTGRSAISQTLLKRGASVTERDEAGYTALHLAVAIGHVDLVKRLLLAGAPINALVGDETALGLARRSHQMHIAALLRQCGGSS